MSPLGVTLVVSGQDQIDAGLKRIRVTAERRLTSLSKGVATKFGILAYNLAPKRTGQLRAGFMINGPFRRGMTAYSELANTSLHYLYYVEGTRPHVILPRVKRALWWEDIKVGHPIPRANHPGWKGFDLAQKVYDLGVSNAIWLMDLEQLSQLIAAEWAKK